MDPVSRLWALWGQGQDSLLHCSVCSLGDMPGTEEEFGECLFTGAISEHTKTPVSICQKPCLYRNTGYVCGFGEDLLKAQILEWVPPDDQEPQGQVLISGQEDLGADSDAFVHTSSLSLYLSTNCGSVHIKFTILNTFKMHGLVVLSTFTLLCNQSAELFKLWNWNSVPFKYQLLSLPPSSPGNHHPTFCLYEFDCSRYVI